MANWRCRQVLLQINEPIPFGLPIIMNPVMFILHSGSADSAGRQLVAYYLAYSAGYQYCAVDHANRVGGVPYQRQCRRVAGCAI